MEPKDYFLIIFGLPTFFGGVFTTYYYLSDKRRQRRSQDIDDKNKLLDNEKKSLEIKKLKQDMGEPVTKEISKPDERQLTPVTQKPDILTRIFENNKIVLVGSLILLSTSGVSLYVNLFSQEPLTRTAVATIVYWMAATVFFSLGVLRSVAGIIYDRRYRKDSE